MTSKRRIMSFAGGKLRGFFVDVTFHGDTGTPSRSSAELIAEGAIS